MYRTVYSWKEIYDDLLLTKPSLSIVQGCAGSGKSTLLKELWKHDPSHTLCLAPTGIAAQNIRDGGCPAATIHSAFRRKPVDIHIFQEGDYEDHKNMLRSINMLIIDEMSMIDISLMEWILSLLEASSMDGHVIMLVLLGDVCQLPPVFKVPIELKSFKERKFGNNRFFFNSPSFSSLDPRIYLMDKVYRQQDEAFSNALLSLRKKPVSKKSLKLINSRVCNREEFAESCESSFLTVVATNKEKDEINEEEQSRLEESGAEFNVYQTSYEGRLMTLDAGRIPSEIVIHEGEQIMCTCNCDDYQNGTIGIVERFSNDNLPIVRGVNGMLFEVQMHTLSELVPRVRNGQIEYIEGGSITMLGCQSAYAATVHKIQGLTLDKLYFQLGDWIPESGVYVALSRCRHLDDIGISRPITRKDIRYSKEALSFFNKFMDDAA